MSNRGAEPPPGDDRAPISSAIHDIAASIHQDLMLELQRGTSPPDVEASMTALRNSYPPLLFGELAMHVAGIELPHDALQPIGQRV